MKPIEFYDMNQGPMLLREWNGDPWLFYKGAEGQWVSLRIADKNDLARLVPFIDDEEGEQWQQALGRSQKG